MTCVYFVWIYLNVFYSFERMGFQEFVQCSRMCKLYLFRLHVLDDCRAALSVSVHQVSAQTRSHFTKSVRSQRAHWRPGFPLLAPTDVTD